jgi:transcriptional regulator with XRE-family HTH domain
MPTDPLPPWVLREREQVGRRIREVRRERGLSQEKLAELAGLGRHSVYRVELGTHSGSIDAVLLIAKALGVPPTRFFRDQ